MIGKNSFAQLNIDSCQAKAKTNYPLIKQYDLIEKSLEYTISNANKAYLPQISVNGIGAYIIAGFPTVSIPGQKPPEKENLQFIEKWTANLNIRLLLRESKSANDVLGEFDRDIG